LDPASNRRPTLTRDNEDSFWALLASGQINLRKVDGWQSLAAKPIDQPIDLAA
jgi:hypothetical protein